MEKIAITVAITLIVGCSTLSKKEIAIAAPFDESTAKHLLESGKNKVTGSALIRQNGGGVVTCAGRPVHLIPATAYAKERIMAKYGNVDRGFASEFDNNSIVFKPDYPEFSNLIKTVLCDAQGYFIFSDIADGEFFVTTSIVWQIGSHVQGGGLIYRVKLKDGHTENVVLSP